MGSGQLTSGLVGCIISIGRIRIFSSLRRVSLRSADSFPEWRRRSPSICIMTNMRFAAKITDADLNGVRKDTRSATPWRAIKLGAIPKLVFRGWAVLMALASIAALSLVGTLSLAGYGAARLNSWGDALEGFGGLRAATHCPSSARTTVAGRSP